MSQVDLHFRKFLSPWRDGRRQRMKEKVRRSRLTDTPEGKWWTHLLQIDLKSAGLTD